MNKEMAEEKLKQYQALLKECENDLKRMCPAFEFDTKAVANLNKKYEDLRAKVDMLKDYLKGGGGDDR